MNLFPYLLYAISALVCSAREHAVQYEEIEQLHRKLTTFDKPRSFHQLRYASFGTSVTWGSTLSHPGKQAYIKLLSPNATNLAMRASDPSYPSVCTQSMMGDSLYDVIVIEYERRYREGLEALVKRVRDRFPDGTIILTNLWTYMNVNVHENGKVTPFRQWMMNHGHNKNTEESLAFVKNYKNITFSFIDHHLRDKQEHMDMLAEKYGVFIYKFRTMGDMRKIVLGHLPMYAKDYVHLSEAGHRFVANRIKVLVKTAFYRKSHSFQSRLGSWGLGDVCNNWLTTGKAKGIVDTNGIFTKFSENYGAKYALQFPPLRKGFFTINNPLKGPRELSLTFMGTGPDPSIYPDTRISIDGGETTILSPQVKNSTYPVHMQMIRPVGKITPGLNTIYILPLTKKEQDFRLVGYSITHESNKISYMFLKGVMKPGEKANPFKKGKKRV